MEVELSQLVSTSARTRPGSPEANDLTGGAYYLYKAGGNPKVAEKQMERMSIALMRSRLRPLNQNTDQDRMMHPGFPQK